MEIRYSHIFQKQYHKLPKKVQLQFDERLALWLIDGTDPRLRVHPLRGKYVGYWSMNVNGDVRALYLQHGGEVTIFALIGTHSSLYG